eukprot:SAG11_NODE_9608_length_896_cov_1.340025_1_plen_29_part_01
MIEESEKGIELQLQHRFQHPSIQLRRYDH